MCIGEDGPPTEKKVRIDSTSSSGNINVSIHCAAKLLFLSTLDTGELEMYGADLSSGLANPSVQLSVTDTLLNVGPIKNCTVGQPGFLSEEVSV